MRPQQPDDFVRENRPMADWIIALINPEPALQAQAALALSAMHMGVRDPQADITAEMLPADPEAHRAAFGAAVRAAVDAPGFPRRAYIEALFHFIEENQERWMGQTRRQNQRVDRVISKITARMTPDASAETLEWEQRRLLQALCASASGKSAPDFSNAEVWAGIIFNQLDQALLEAPESLGRWLGGKGLRVSARDAVQRLGSAAVAFAPQLLADLDAFSVRGDWWWDEARTLAAAGGQDLPTIRALVLRLEGPPALCGNAASVLGLIGPRALEVAPDLVERMLSLSRSESELVRLASFQAMASLGGEKPEVQERLVEAALHGKNFEPGYAIETFEPRVLPAERAVPLLIGCFETFEEFDPDREYQGEHARLAEALARYGPAAAPAIPTLIAHLGGAEGFNESVVRCLAAMGSAANDAAPALAKVARDAGIENVAADETYVGEAWRVITRRGGGGER